MWFTARTRARIQSIKIQNQQSKEMIEIIQKVIDHERQKEMTPEIETRLNELDIDLGEHRILIADNEALIAKLEEPFLKFWKWMF